MSILQKYGTPYWATIVQIAYMALGFGDLASCPTMRKLGRMNSNVSSSRKSKTEVPPAVRLFRYSIW